MSSQASPRRVTQTVRIVCEDNDPWTERPKNKKPGSMPIWKRLASKRRRARLKKEGCEE